MPTTVIAQAGQTLCDIAIDAGFVNCQPIRDEAGNAGKPFLTRQLQEGESVVVPDVKPDQFDKPVEQEHKFVKKNAPPVLIRFVHGSPDKPYRQDSTTTFLNISNFVTNKGGTNGNQPFPTATVFDQKGDVDPDAFKLEVVDASAGGTVTVKLEALKPIYSPTGTLDHNEPFTGADAGPRSNTITLKAVPSNVCFRSPYLRLVVDPEDQAAVPAQTLLVTDMADGNNGDNDKVEILDQKVRASYVRQACPGSPQCTSVAEVPIAPDKKRVRLCIHGIRANVGDGATAIGGVTEANLRRRTMRWFRRLYAQAQLAPQFVDPVVEFLDPPPDNMLVISDASGATASGINSAGAASSLTFTLTTSPARAATDPPDPVVTVNLGGAPTPLTPEQVGAKIVAALPAGFTGVPDTNCRALNAANGSCDILITRTDNKRVVITNETTNDTGLLAANAFAVARVNIQQVALDTPAPAFQCWSKETRRVIRTAPGNDSRIDVYIVGALFRHGHDAARGTTLTQGADLPVEFQPKVPMRYAVLMGDGQNSAAVMDGADHDPYSYPHEGGHVINDAFHCKSGTPGGPTEMMTGNGTDSASAVNASKRICDAPLKVIYAMYNPDPAVQKATPGTTMFQAINAVTRMRARGTSVFGEF